MKVLISHPGFSDFHHHFKKYKRFEVFLHRNYDLNSAVFRICRFLRVVNVLYKINTQSFISIYKKNQIDVAIIFKGCSIDLSILDKKKIYYKIYLWDSLSNIYNGFRYINLPQKVITFDLQDSIKYSFRYLPLFHFLDDFSRANGNKQRMYISLYGNYSRERVKLLNSITKYEQIDYPLYHFLTISIFLFLKEVLIGRQSFSQLWKFTTFKKLTRAKIDQILKNSLATIDYANMNQSGMTTRTFEALSLSTKLITNNLTTYNLCKEYNYPCLLNDFQTGFLVEGFYSFIKQDFEVSQEFLKRFSIENFLDDILKLN